MELNLEQIIALVKEVLPEGIELSNISTSGEAKVSIALLKHLDREDLDLSKEDFSEDGLLLPEVCDKIVNDFASDMDAILKNIESKLPDTKVEVIPNGFSGNVRVAFDDGALSDGFAFDSDLQVLVETVIYQVGNYLNPEEEGAKLDYNTVELNKDDLSDEVPEADIEIATIASEEPERPNMNEEPFDEGIDFKALAEKYLGPDEDEDEKPLPEDEDIWEVSDNNPNDTTITREIADPLSGPDVDLKGLPDEAKDWYEKPTNEALDEVACEDCFEIFPKEDCVKTEHGYVCKVCDQARHSHQGTNLDLVDKDPFDLEYDDPRLSKKEEEPEVKDEPLNANEVRKHEAGIDEDLKVIKDFGDYHPWSGAEDTYNKIKDAGKLEDLEAWLEEIFPDGATETEINDVLWFEPEQCFIAVGLSPEDGDADDAFDQDFDTEEKKDESLKEYYDDPDYWSDETGPEYLVSYDGKPVCYLQYQYAGDPAYGGHTPSNKEVLARAKECLATKMDEVDDTKIVTTKVEDDAEIDGNLDVIDVDYDWKADESLEEHINDRPADIESDQEYQGVDNAVVDCKKYTLVAHSEDEKPVDCKLEKPALEEPVAGKEVEGKFYEHWSDALTEGVECSGTCCPHCHSENIDIVDDDGDSAKYICRDCGNDFIVHNDGEVTDRHNRPIESLEEAKKDEDEIPPDPEVVKLEVHQELNDLVADEIEAINGYEEVKADILDKPIEHKDDIVDTINHIEDEEKEHIDELIDATTEIPFEGDHKEEAISDDDAFNQDFSEEESTKEDRGEEEESLLNQDFPVEEQLTEDKSSGVKVGDKIRIIQMIDPYVDYNGKEGTVEHIDDIGQVHGTWGGCAVVPGEDEFELITDECLKESKDDEFDFDAPETFTDEEREENELDEDGCDDSGEQWHHCGFCQEVFPESDLRAEASWGWLCDRCIDSLKSHTGDKLYFIECAKHNKSKRLTESNDVEYIDSIEAGTGQAGDGPYYDGFATVYLNYDKKDKTYFAEYAVENENGPIEDPEPIDLGEGKETKYDFEKLSDLLDALVKAGYIKEDDKNGIDIEKIEQKFAN